MPEISQELRYLLREFETASNDMSWESCRGPGGSSLSISQIKYEEVEERLFRKLAELEANQKRKR